MGPDDLLCSCNARPQKGLVGRAQWKVHQPPPLRDNELAWKGLFEHEGGSLLISLARATRGLRRPSLDTRSESSSKLPSLRRQRASLEGSISGGEWWTCTP